MIFTWLSLDQRDFIHVGDVFEQQYQTDIAIETFLRFLGCNKGCVLRAWICVCLDPRSVDPKTEWHIAEGIDDLDFLSSHSLLDFCFRFSWLSISPLYESGVIL